MRNKKSQKKFKEIFFFLENYLTTIRRVHHQPPFCNKRIQNLASAYSLVPKINRPQDLVESTSSKYFFLAPTHQHYTTTLLLNPAFRPLKGLGPPFNKKVLKPWRPKHFLLTTISLVRVVVVTLHLNCGLHK